MKKSIILLLIIFSMACKEKLRCYRFPFPDNNICYNECITKEIEWCLKSNDIYDNIICREEHCKLLCSDVVCG